MKTENLIDAMLAEAIKRATDNNTMLTYTEAKALLKALNLNLKSKEDYQNWWKDSLYNTIVPENPAEYYKYNK